MLESKSSGLLAATVPQWGAPGTPLLPSAVRGVLATEPLPSWVRRDLGLFPTATFAALDRRALRLGPCPDRVRAFVLKTIKARIDVIIPLRAIPWGWPQALDHNLLPWRRRTRNCLINGGVLRAKEPGPLMPAVTFGALLKIQGMGIISILDFASVAEAAIEQVATREEMAAIEQANSGEESNLDALIEVIDCDWATQVSAQDPRFADLLPAHRADLTILEQIDLFTREPSDDGAEIAVLANLVPALRDRLRILSKLPLDTALQHLVGAASGLGDHRLDALVARLGWAGEPPVTLAMAGAMVGLTRERIRQLEKRTLERFPDHPVFMPQLDAALELIAGHAPTNIEGAAELLRDSGLTVNSFDPKSLLLAARACHRTPIFELETIRGHRRVVTTSLVGHADAIISIGYRQAEASGASNVQEVLAEALAAGIPTDEEEVRDILISFSAAEFLDEDWFWRPEGKPHRNRLRNLTRKLISLVTEVDLGTLRDGLRREYKFRRYRGMGTWPITVPPRSILALLYERHPEFVIEGEVVTSVGGLDYKRELREGEQILVEVLQAAPGGVLDRASCVRGCVARGMNENTLSIYLTYSLLIAHLGIDMWSVRGVDVDPATVEAIRQANAQRPRERRVLDHGWTREGTLWAAARLPEHPSKLVFGIPGPIRHYVAGREFPAFDEYSAPCGSIGITSDGASYGYSPFLRRRGGDEGDILIVEFDLSGKRVVLFLGDEDSLETRSSDG